MSPELIGAIGTALTGILAGFAAFSATRSRRAAEDRKTLRRQARIQQQRELAALGHIYLLERRMRARGLPVPDRPAILEVDADDDESAAHASAPSDAT